MITAQPSTLGSQWRKWDLHVHTPKSLIQHYGGDTPEVWDRFISDLESLPTEYKVLGINDYFFIDGYKKVRQLKKNGRLANIDLILPVIELRIDKFASIGDEAWKKVNLHIIFSDDITPSEIEAQFISAIQHSYRLSPDIEYPDFKGVITKETLINIGKAVKRTAGKKIPGTDLQVGFSNVTFNYEKVLEIANGYFREKCLIAVGKTEWDTMRWDGSAALKKDIINTAHFTFISLAKPEDYNRHVQFLLKQNVRSQLIDCSDAHDFANSDQKDRIGNCFTWIKADTTFDGLKHVANINSRIFVGDKPSLLTRLHSSSRKFIKSLNIRKLPNSPLKEQWFDGLHIDLNPSMVAIIGNKGQGKSALADIIGLLGNTRNYHHSSFLNEDRFRRTKPLNKSREFKAELAWADGTRDTATLDQNPPPTSVEKVKYLPQGFLEELCNEDVDDFEQELRTIIFSHIEETDRLGFTSLNNLIGHKTEQIELDIQGAKDQLHSINKKIVDLEHKLSPGFRKGIEENLKEIQGVLAAHEKSKPSPVPATDDSTIVDQSNEVSRSIASKRNELRAVEAKITNKRQRIKESKIEISNLEKVAQKLEGFEQQYKNLRIEIRELLKQYEVEVQQLFVATIDTTQLTALIQEKADDIDECEKELNGADSDGLLVKKAALEREISGLQARLDAPAREYQQYLDALKAWQDRHKEIIGTSETEGSIEFYKDQLKYLDDKLVIDLSAAYSVRATLVEKLLQKKEAIVSLYKSLYSPVTSFITSYSDLLDTYSLKLDVEFKVDGFLEKFFDHVSLGARGSFQGNPGGIERLRQILEKYDLNSKDHVTQFLNEVGRQLRSDHRDGLKLESRQIEAQLKKGYSVLDLYDFLYNLDYLQPEYKLKLGNKSISELSPGERGALLLIFYLAIDQNDYPLVIDQPEENLDNQSVFKILVKFIQKAKERRQIIIVTHNPNLAVACDAEQIIQVSMDKVTCAIKHLAGALENPSINNAVIDILEGTYPALSKRITTYSIIRRDKHSTNHNA